MGLALRAWGIKLGLLVVAGGRHRDQARRHARRDALAPRYPPPRAVEVDCAAGPDGRAWNRGPGSILANQLSPLLDAGYLEEAVRRHFEPLLDPVFDDLLRPHYPPRHWLRSGTAGNCCAGDNALFSSASPLPSGWAVRRTPSAGAGFRNAIRSSPAVERQGIAISTFGKVIRRGWDWLGSGAAAAPSCLGGLIEVPDLAACLTLSKNDSSVPVPVARRISHTARRSGGGRPTARRVGRCPRRDARPRTYGWSGTSSACSKIWPMIPLLRSWSTPRRRAKTAADARRGREQGAGPCCSPSWGNSRRFGGELAQALVGWLRRAGGQNPGETLLRHHAGASARATAAGASPPPTQGARAKKRQDSPLHEIPRFRSIPGGGTPTSPRHTEPSIPWSDGGGRRATDCWCSSNAVRATPSSVGWSTAPSG